MAWDQLGTSWPHVAYATTGFALLLFGTISLFLKEKLYIGEATLATIFGLIVGPHCLDWFSPEKWGNTDYITLEVSRIVLVVQIFAVAVELPKKYVWRHWFSLFMLLVPVMTYGWLISSVFIWKLVPTLRWIEALAVAACITATDPVLASAVVGKGKFAKRVPGHLRNLLSAESGCNDGMAFPFALLAVNILEHEGNAGEIAKDFIAVSVLYECIFGCLIGAVIGYVGRVLIKFAEKYNLIDRESLLAYYFCMAVFCAGIGTILGIDDLLVAFCAGTAFSWDGWFAKQTEESHVSNVIDVLLNTAYFIYFGAIVPWNYFNHADIGLRAWKLVLLAIIVLVVRRLPIMLLIKPVIPDIKTWREALFCGHFGPIGVGGLFIAILVRAELETGGVTPLKELPAPTEKNYYAIATIWPITCFLVISSIIVHGSSIAVFTLGKRLNNMAITMTYTRTQTQGGEPSWMKRLPFDGSGLRLEKVETETVFGNKNKKRRKPKIKRKNKAPASEEEPPKNVEVSLSLEVGDETVKKTEILPSNKILGKDPKDIRAYLEGSHVVVEDDEGNFVHDFDIGSIHGVTSVPQLEIKATEKSPDVSEPSSDSGVTRVEGDDESVGGSERSLSRPVSVHSRSGQHGRRQVFACMVDNNVILENEDGEIIKRYRVHRKGEPSDANKTKWEKFTGMFRQRKDHEDEPDIEHSSQDRIVPIEGDESDVADKNSIGNNPNILRRLEKMVQSDGLFPNADSGHRRQIQVDVIDARNDPSSPENDEEEGVEYDDPHVESHDEEEDDETEVERNRRLAALGVLDTSERSEARAGSSHMSGIAEENSDTKLTFSLPKKPH
ncbi:Na(+)/H(+) antiporter [Wickerhamiella sorbophila]|uniref:Na(+)/H(+) antiporter n=1 Tax=Wickerhamiella sorbophila TaxID=45607 RepID=A0A2T0FE05_9ASCO|nr:Na(+)/H(+) antiporter [Wickerhamiella sorbophila]PRT53232.1 Na(+)/H(+) antiporter [Wickerhamiella sorbophila]